MSFVQPKSQKLKAGEHYGKVSHKLQIPSAVLSESVYREKISLPEHSHELGFFTLIIEGGYSEQFGSESLFYSPMTVLWRQAEISHKDKIESGSSHFFFVEIKRDYFEKLLEYEKVPERLSERSGMLTWLAARLRGEIRDERVYSPLVAEGITLEMLGYLARRGVTLEKRSPRWLARVVERLNAEFTENLTAEELAAEAGVHPVHLAAVFRRFEHQSLGEYVQKLRVDYASRLLLDRDLPLAEIAYSAGFSDQSHFTRVFKRCVGLTPGAFRNSIDR
jgi:AraC family transcriptional regulator